MSRIEICYKTRMGYLFVWINPKIVLSIKKPRLASHSQGRCVGKLTHIVYSSNNAKLTLGFIVHVIVCFGLATLLNPVLCHPVLDGP